MAQSPSSLAGKRAGKKDLGLIAMSYKNVYVGRIAIGANDAQALKPGRAPEIASQT